MILILTMEKPKRRGNKELGFQLGSLAAKLHPALYKAVPWVDQMDSYFRVLSREAAMEPEDKWMCFKDK